MINPFGDVFPDTIIRDNKIRHKKTGEGTGKDFLFRIYILTFITALAMGILYWRLFVLTVVEGSQYKRMAQENRIREINISAPRGIIYDRNKNPLIRNIPLITDISGKMLNTPSGENDIESIEASTREYIYGDVFGNLLGYIGETDPDDLKKLASVGNKTLDNQPYKLRDTIGKMGIEKVYDRWLRGNDGQELFEVNATGNYIRTLGRVEATTGNNLILNIDLELSKKATEILKGQKAGIIASDPETGSILLLVSSPSFDPNIILKDEDISTIFANPDQPLFNRAIAGLYPPGSTFKIVTALSALESGSVNAKSTVEDTGVLNVGENYSFANWYFTQYGKTEGQVDLVKAIQRSNDIYFYKAGEFTGISNLAKWARIMGTGKLSGIDLDGEEKGLMPDPQWQKKIKGENWFLGNTYHTAIGQGDVLTTPLQVNLWTNVIASNGKLCRPNISQSKKENCIALPFIKDNIKLVKDGMVKACQTGGTGWPLFNFTVENDKINIDGINFLEAPQSTASAKKRVEVTTACKTGTAEFGDEKDRTHAWFTVFAPVEKPQISLTILIEGGGEGSSVAGPVAKELLKLWFER
ncbi:hypothetical protein A3D05_01030 [Candidatus Gottesmanbacteria bacterium RIFCSPHIGHO2_02_FULL_40_24]|uniref:Beta-lactamase n=1 Tax=Candidatus Gottesmanbacteria bacterium RIFCSPHIGHO2_01_FULL_40_15 TaxID=1798376 RepID=A0A1F5YZQ3_9BACT|nr:MAG: hypothetical protein A2777_00375 [Candidatus Gottesmanbacteria bacterium RIFCSPHIGHO2_01_FULL_40_15]OGG17060.1 MAG: hypothetical protein A3D05_01030 [Candidatus Gottesmanbacteria bacterium RIFCSPHIGHO2_02_FULL_40_24]OGG23420.1 MAG: hypothetical protein A3E42_00035 [Candidatus Gottesmanbacteria bacterium RIFCSPHIGHO2_12_FULL_40_13]OGG33019.1 MAG: hypothetical protein A3I80_03815 [Candidatus Gottesmanbacteria bacterium RIFCSPLOWO2_02_FULL_40_10]